MLVGFGLAKAKLPYDNKMVGSLVWTVGYPALILTNLTGQDALLDELLGVMFLGGLAIPLMLLTLGHTLATLNVAVLSRGVVLSVLHLIMAAAVAFSLVRLLDLDGLVRGVFILQCMMPAQVASYLWVKRYDPDDAPGVAGFILVSTVLSVIVLPVVLTFWI